MLFNILKGKNGCISFGYGGTSVIYGFAPFEGFKL